ncbi:MAG: nitroreductase family protein [Coriobacteriales bacterium]|jgi:nitroreductase
MSVRHFTRRDFLQAGGLVACGTAALGAQGALALASEKGDSTGASGSNSLGIIDALAGRRTLHGLEADQYDPDALVTDEELQAILTAGFSAPSAVAQQTLEFVVVTDRNAMLPIIDHNENANELKTCPMVIVLVEHDADGGHPRFYQYDSGIAAMAMVAQATALGLCTCIVSMKQTDDSNETIYYDSIGLAQGSDEYHPQLMVTLGHPAVDAVTGASVDNYDEARIHDQTIGA